jgi:hypothetical protein
MASKKSSSVEAAMFVAVAADDDPIKLRGGAIGGGRNR